MTESLLEKLSAAEEIVTSLRLELNELLPKHDALITQLNGIRKHLGLPLIDQSPPPKTTPVKPVQIKASQASLPATRLKLTDAIRQALTGGKTMSAPEIYEAVLKNGFVYKGKRDLPKALVDACKNMADDGMLSRTGTRFKPNYSMGRSPMTPGERGKLASHPNKKDAKVKQATKPATEVNAHPVPKPTVFGVLFEPTPKPAPKPKRKADCVEVVLEGVRLLTGLNGDQWARPSDIINTIKEGSTALLGVKDPRKKVYNVLYRCCASGRLEYDGKKGYRLPINDRK